MPTYFASIGLPLDELIADELQSLGGCGSRIIVESFEQIGARRVPGARGPRPLRVPARVDAARPPTWSRGLGAKALPYSAQLTDAGLARLAQGGRRRQRRQAACCGCGGDAVATDLVEPGPRLRALRLHLDATPREPVPHAALPPRSKAADWGDWRAEFADAARHRRRRHLRRPPGPRRRGPRRGLSRGGASPVAPRIGRP